MKAGKISHIIAIALLSLFAIALYLNSLNNPFIFDDFPNIVNNPYIRNLKDIPLFLKGLLTYTNPFRLLPNVSFAINYHFHKVNVFGYHVVNLVLHILSGLLVYFIARNLFILESERNKSLSDDPKSLHRQKTNYLSLLAAAIFISHPIQVNAVTYIVERNEVFASLFYLLGFYLFMKMGSSRGRPKALLVFGIPLIFFLAVLSKEISFTFPINLALFDLMYMCENREMVKRRLKVYIGIGLPLILYPIFFLRGGIFAMLFRQSHPWTPWENFLTQSNVIIQYFKLILLPLLRWLNIDHGFQISKSLFEYPTFVSISIILFLLILATGLIRKKRLISFSIFWFFIVLAPTSSIIPIPDIMVEYRLYLPMFSLSLILALGLHYLFQLLARYHSKILGQGVVWGISILILSFYSVVTVERNKIFGDELTLWSDAVKKSPEKIRPKISLVGAYNQHGLYDQAIATSLEVLKREPRDHQIYTKLGVSYMFKRDYDKAIDAFKTSIEINENNPIAYNNLGIIYLERKDFDQAIAFLRKAMALDPDRAEAYNNLAKTFATKGLLDEAIKEEKEAIRIDPTMAEYHFNLAKLYENKGRFNDSVEEYRKALKLEPNFFEAYHHLGMVYSKIENSREAINAFQKAIELNPKSGKTYFMLGINYIKTGDREKAIWNLEKALQYALNEKDKKAIESTLIKLRSIPNKFNSK